MRRMPVPGLHPERGMQDDERLSRVLPAKSAISSVIGPLAVSLAQQRWERASLVAHLNARLPPPLAHLADPMTRRLLHALPGASAPDPARILAALQTSASADRLVAHALKTGTRPALTLSPPVFRASARLAALPPLSVPAELEDWLSLPPGQLIRFADLRNLSALTVNAFAPHYHQHLIPKLNGGMRLIEEPKPYLKRLQRRILHGLLDRVPVHPAACGFVPGRNAIQGASRHAGEAMVIAFDLADFFPRIPFARIYSLFRALGYPRAVAMNLTGLTTTVAPPRILRTPNLAAADALSARHLPQGAPTSPALANLSALQLDRRLSGLARSCNAAYTRYADDLTFSGDAGIAPLLLRAVPQIIADAGFRPNPAKTRVMPAHFRQIVTGLTVNRHINIPRKTYDELKATIHHIARPGDPRRSDPAFITSLSGHVAWVEQVHPARGHRLRNALADALG
jgi:RNA-directed DNA polymerase